MAMNAKDLTPLSHHQQQEVCLNRARYRQGRKETAVKVYTIHQESRYILIQGVPSLGLQDELERRLSTYGEIVAGSLKPAYEYPSEQFTVAYLVKFSRLQSAKFAKRKLDNQSFYGSPLHVCYAPEHETIEDTKNKLIERQNYIQRILNPGSSGKRFSRFHQVVEESPTPSSIEAVSVPVPPTTYIWAGKEYTYSVNESTEAKLESEKEKPPAQTSFLPRQLSMKHKLENSSADPSEYISAEIASKLQKVATPNTDVNFKKKKSNTEGYKIV